MHQMLVVDPKWVEEAKDDLKQRLKEKMSIAADVVKKFKRGHEYKFLKECHPNAWTPPKLGDILSGKTNYASTGKATTLIPYPRQYRTRFLFQIYFLNLCIHYGAFY